ncbi:SPOR domain-containing protein [Bombella intestini]|uniref:SPOR domain-containing protein n=1 Tax=Bombella intestini TaxID=1539051 RepID=UPI000985692D|nr:SPOR domain-containing protein [Bombella intestini]
MSMPDDYHNDIAPPQADDRLGGGSYRPPPRSYRPDAHRGERAEARPSLLASLMGRQSGTRGLMVLGAAGAVLLLGVGGVWSWVASHHPSGVPVIGPPPYPVKDRPADPGGMMVMGDDTTKSDVTGRGAVHLAPPPEQPDASLLAGRMTSPPASSGNGTTNNAPAGGEQAAASQADETEATGDDVAHDEQAQSTPHPSETVADKPAKTATADKAPSSGDTPAPKATASSSGDDEDEAEDAGTEEEVKKPVVKKKPTPARKAVVADNDLSGDVLPPPAPAKKTSPAPSAPAEVHRKSAGAVGGAGRYEVQLAALGSDEQARQEWSRLRRKLPDLLGSYEPVYRKVERDGKTFIRLRVGGFEDRAAARQLCVRLHAQAQACAVATN